LTNAEGVWDINIHQKTNRPFADPSIPRPKLISWGYNNKIQMNILKWKRTKYLFCSPKIKTTAIKKSILILTTFADHSIN